MRDETIIGQVLQRHPRMLQDANRRATEPWFAADQHSHERFKFEARLTADILTSFRGRCYGGIGLEPIDFGLTAESFFTLKETTLVKPSESVADYKSIVEKHAMYFINDLINKAAIFQDFDKRDLLKIIFDKHLFGADVAFCNIAGEKLPVSIFSARMAPRAMYAKGFYQQHTSAPLKSVLELGGGFGRCLRDCLAINPIETAYYVDLPLNVGLAATYLEACFPNRVNLVWDETDDVIAGKINIVTPWLIDKINEPIDLMINFLSLHHMPQETMDYYFGNLICPKVKFLYHENRLVPRSTHEGEGSLLNVPGRPQFTIHAGPEMTASYAFPKKDGTPFLTAKTIAEFMVNKAF
ncbi:MAG: putative sugar O-methyltransferase [Rhodospirillaceae bacterium]